MKIKEAIFSLNPNQLKNFSIYGFGQFINLVSPLLVTPYLIYVCGVQNFGKIGLKEGLYMASSDEIHLTIHGKGGHGATPAACIDPIVIGAATANPPRYAIGTS